MESYLLIYLSSTLLAIIITPITILLARRFDVVDIPNVRKVHSKPIPRIGGIAIYIPMMSVILSALFFNNPFGGKLINFQPAIIVLLSVATFIFLVGLIDDIKNLRATIKLTCQFAAAVFVCSMGFRINTISFSDSLVVNFGWFSWPLTILWIVGITNAVNFIDGLDGLAAGLSAVACGVMVVLSIYFHQAAMTVIMLAMLGALTGFLYFNFNPAKIFMGDCGSLLLGFTIATSSVMFATKSQAIVSLTLPILALGIPIFDTLSSILRRFLARRSLFSPDFEHFHHKLMALGLKQHHVVIIAYLITVFASGFGMFMILSRSFQSILIFGCILILLLLVFRFVGLVKLDVVLSHLKQKYNISSLIKLEKESFEKARLYFCKAETFSQWWKSVCIAAETMNFANVILPLTNRDGSKHLLTWDKENNVAGHLDRLTMIIPVRDRRAGSQLTIKVNINTNGSIESAGRRARLFNRLIEEYSVEKLATKTFEQLALQSSNF